MGKVLQNLDTHAILKVVVSRIHWFGYFFIRKKIITSLLDI